MLSVLWIVMRDLFDLILVILRSLSEVHGASRPRTVCCCLSSHQPSNSREDCAYVVVVRFDDTRAQGYGLPRIWFSTCPKDPLLVERTTFFARGNGQLRRLQQIRLSHPRLLGIDMSLVSMVKNTNVTRHNPFLVK